MREIFGVKSLFNKERYLTKWNQKFLISKRIDNIKFIHIGKCGGTSIMHYLLSNGLEFEEYHLRKPPIHKNTKYFMWIRDPISRFVSAFNHLKEIVEFPINEKTNPNELKLSNCPAPEKIKNKFKKGYAFSNEIDCCIRKFKSAEELISSLSSRNKSLRLDAEKIMDSEYEHIKKGIAWYLHYGKFIEKNHNKFLMIGTVENFAHDFNNFLLMIGLPQCTTTPHIRKTQNRSLNSISKTTKEYLIKNYLFEDYNCLNLLRKHSLILDDYHIF